MYLGGTDYSSGPYIITIPAGVISIPFDVPINDDNLVESSESFNLSINVVSLPRNITIEQVEESKVMIVDNDSKEVVPVKLCILYYQSLTCCARYSNFSCFCVGKL